MPNQRKKGKKHAGSWLDDPVFAALQERAEQAGVSISDMMKRYVEDGLGFAPRSSAKGKRVANDKD